MKDKAIVADIKRASTHDGPGLRTTVFFKGCPLECAWCHNPECIDRNIQILHYPEKCIGCGMCDKGCFAGAKVTCGKEMSAEEIFEVILQDKCYYGNDGGVTFSGGEPLLYPHILKKLIKLCTENGINTAIETSLFIYNEDILCNLDFIMADFKIFDSKKHKDYTGVPNEDIKENFKLLDRINVPFLVRTPIICGINDSAEEICSIRDFIRGFKNIKGYELLPYHPLGEVKRKALGLEENNFSAPDSNRMRELETYAKL